MIRVHETNIRLRRGNRITEWDRAVLDDRTDDDRTANDCVFFVVFVCECGCFSGPDTAQTLANFPEYQRTVASYRLVGA